MPLVSTQSSIRTIIWKAAFAKRQRSLRGTLRLAWIDHHHHKSPSFMYEIQIATLQSGGLGQHVPNSILDQFCNSPKFKEKNLVGGVIFLAIFNSWALPYQGNKLSVEDISLH